MKVTKNGITFSNEEMREFVFPIMAMGLANQVYEYSTAPKVIRKDLKQDLDKWYPYSQELTEKSGMKLLGKNKRGMYEVTVYSKDNPAKFNRHETGVATVTERPTKKKKK